MHEFKLFSLNVVFLYYICNYHCYPYSLPPVYEFYQVLLFFYNTVTSDPCSLILVQLFYHYVFFFSRQKLTLRLFFLCKSDLLCSSFSSFKNVLCIFDLSNLNLNKIVVFVLRKNFCSRLFRTKVNCRDFNRLV